MKDFLKMLCAVVCGLLLTGCLGLFLFVGCVGTLVSSDSQPVMPRSGVLNLDLADVVFGEQTASDFDAAALLSGSASLETVGLFDLVRAIGAAAEDPAVKFIFLKPDGCTAGISALEELRAALVKFRESGKAVIAYTENPSTGSYYLASAADKVYMSANAGASPMITGISSQLFFLGDLLKELGVNVQLIRHGKYKSAGEMYIKNQPSPENLEQNQVMINSIWSSLSEDIARSRDLSAGQLDRLIDGLQLVTAGDMVEAGLADGLMTREQLREKLADLAVEEKFSDVKMISFKDYITLKVKPNTKVKQKIAVLYAEGNIVDGKGRQQVAGDHFASLIAKLREDDAVKAVVLRVASPGGSVLASDKIRTEIDLLRAEKPVIASYGDYAASGGYWISNSCDRIYSDRTTLTGSIGVFSMIPDVSRTVKEKLKVGVAAVGSGPHSDMMSLLSPLDAAETEFMQKSVEIIYDAFLANVSEGRDMTPEQVDEIAQGRVWTGADALGIGLVDEIGGLDEALRFAAQAAGDTDLNNWQVVTLPKAPSTLDLLMESLGQSHGNDILARTPFAPIGAAFRNWSVETGDRFMARMPYEVIIGF